ncbi:gustatory receptor for sugar taste 64b-like [Vanessa cardui]|uniref:gustatory receptor for sugar taste 64b-like n=1 Tax=Vanessa cardui TaxID=171605 RepID=UPI001F13D156|nr:gustatory receptor for sugar taste 64b-like [Vanessa cardui]
MCRLVHFEQRNSKVKRYPNGPLQYTCHMSTTAQEYDAHALAAFCDVVMTLTPVSGATDIVLANSLPSKDSLATFLDATAICICIYMVTAPSPIDNDACAENRRVPWMDLQAHYTRLTRLVRVIDDYINPFVFMTFLSNLVVVCKHIYDIIQRQKALSMNSNNPNCGIAKSSDWIVILDSIIPTLHLIFRTTLVSTFTAHLHTLSREPLRALHTLPASAYNVEVQRFMDQVYHSKIHLSGLGYFYVTRVTVLTMLSTIVTYELVLLQIPVYVY